MNTWLNIKIKNINQQHMNNKQIKWGFKMWYRCTPIRGCLYEFGIFTTRKGITEFGLGKSNVLQLTEKLNGIFFISPLTIFRRYHRC